MLQFVWNEVYYWLVRERQLCAKNTKLRRESGRLSRRRSAAAALLLSLLFSLLLLLRVIIIISFCVRMFLLLLLLVFIRFLLFLLLRFLQTVHARFLHQRELSRELLRFLREHSGADFPLPVRTSH